MQPIVIALAGFLLLTHICTEADAKSSGGSKGQNAMFTQRSPQTGFSAGSSFKKGVTAPKKGWGIGVGMDKDTRLKQ